jgi:hypothetical protein
VYFFVTYGLARNKHRLETNTGSVKDEITELYKNNNKKHTQINKIKK